MTLLEISGSLNMLGYGLATLGPGIGVAMIFSAVINGTARQPEARGAPAEHRLDRLRGRRGAGHHRHRARVRADRHTDEVMLG